MSEKKSQSKRQELRTKYQKPQLIEYGKLSTHIRGGRSGTRDLSRGLDQS